MKKLIALILCIAVCFALGGCSKTPNPEGTYVRQLYNELYPVALSTYLEFPRESKIEIEKADEDYTFKRSGVEGTAKINDTGKLVCKYEDSFTGEKESTKYIIYKDYLIDEDDKSDIDIVDGKLPGEGKNRDCTVDITDDTKSYDNFSITFHENGNFEYKASSTYYDYFDWFYIKGTYEVKGKIFVLTYNEIMINGDKFNPENKLENVYVYIDGDDLYDEVFVKQ